MLDEKFACDQIFIQHDFSSFIMIFSFSFLFLFSLLFLRSVKPIQHFIQHGIFVMLDGMLDQFNKVSTPGMYEIPIPGILNKSLILLSHLYTRLPRLQYMNIWS